jgi:hypothetical protein
VMGIPGLAERMGESARARISGWGFEQNVAGLRQAIAALTKKIAVERESLLGEAELEEDSSELHQMVAEH